MSISILFTHRNKKLIYYFHKRTGEWVINNLWVRYSLGPVLRLAKIITRLKHPAGDQYPFTVRPRLIAMSLAILLWQNRLDFLINQVNHSKKWVVTPIDQIWCKCWHWHFRLITDVCCKRALGCGTFCFPTAGSCSTRASVSVTRLSCRSVY